MSAISGTNGRLHSDVIRLLFLQAHWETDRFFASSGVQSAQSNLGSTYFRFRFHHAAVLNQLKSKCGLLLVKDAALRVTLNLDGAPIISNSHTHPSHSQTSRLLTSSLSLGVPAPRTTQCMRDIRTCLLGKLQTSSVISSLVLTKIASPYLCGRLGFVKV
jgi:hypothetical protein